MKKSQILFSLIVCLSNSLSFALYVPGKKIDPNPLWLPKQNLVLSNSGKTFLKLNSTTWDKISLIEPSSKKQTKFKNCCAVDTYWNKDYIEYSPDDNIVLIFSYLGKITIYDCSSGGSIKSIRATKESGAHFLPDNKRILNFDSTGAVIFDYETEKVEWEYTCKPYRSLRNAAINHKERTLELEFSTGTFSFDLDDLPLQELLDKKYEAILPLRWYERWSDRYSQCKKRLKNKIATVVKRNRGKIFVGGVTLAFLSFVLYGQYKNYQRATHRTGCHLPDLFN